MFGDNLYVDCTNLKSNLMMGRQGNEAEFERTSFLMVYSITFEICIWFNMIVQYKILVQFSWDCITFGFPHGGDEGHELQAHYLLLGRAAGEVVEGILDGGEVALYALEQHEEELLAVVEQ